MGSEEYERDCTKVSFIELECVFVVSQRQFRRIQMIIVLVSVFANSLHDL